jgi:ABC-type bacteriocin/lantibiotic exporter with double-glycine peptidase domain
MSYFETRHIGGINSRFSSLDQIRERITKGFMEALVDGVMSLLIIMWNYSPTLALIVVGSVLLYAAVRFISYHWFHKYNQDSIIAKAKESTHFIETMRSMQTVNLFAAEGNLDVENEVRIASQIKHLGMTRVIIAHRPETIRQSERTINLIEGKIAQDSLN